MYCIGSRIIVAKDMHSNTEKVILIQQDQFMEGIADALSAHAKQSPAPEDEIRLAVRLLAAASQLRAIVGAPRSAAECAEFERINIQLQAEMPSRDFALESERGASMTVEQVVEVALNHLSQISSAADAAGR